MVETHLEKGDRDAAVAEFEEFHKTMGVTADRRALIRALVKVNEIEMFFSTDIPCAQFSGPPPQ